MMLVLEARVHHVDDQQPPLPLQQRACAIAGAKQFREGRRNAILSRFPQGFRPQNGRGSPLRPEAHLACVALTIDVGILWSCTPVLHLCMLQKITCIYDIEHRV